jgi:hypothetical protein
MPYVLFGAAAATAVVSVATYFYGREDGATAKERELRPMISALKKANTAFESANEKFAVAGEAQNKAISILRTACEAAPAKSKAAVAVVERTATERVALAKALQTQRAVVGADQSCDAGLRLVRERMLK